MDKANFKPVDHIFSVKWIAMKNIFEKNRLS